MLKIIDGSCKCECKINVSCLSGYTWNYWDLCKCVANAGGAGAGGGGGGGGGDGGVGSVQLSK